MSHRTVAHVTWARATTDGTPGTLRARLATGLLGLSIVAALVLWAPAASGDTTETGVHPISQGWARTTDGRPMSFTRATDFPWGKISLPGSGQMAEATFATSMLDGSIVATQAFERRPTTGWVGLGPVARRQAGFAYGLMARVTAEGEVLISIRRFDGAATAMSSLTSEVPVGRVAGGGRAWFTLELDVSGQTPVLLRARAWTKGSQVPSWQAVATDASSQRLTTAGHPGIWAYTSQGSGPAIIATESVVARPLAAEPVATPSTRPPVAGGTPTAASPSATAPTSAAPTEPPRPAQAPASASRAGSAPIGSTSYPVPAGSIFVAPNGNDGNPGSSAQPVATLTRAMRIASPGGTVVLRGGSYHEAVTVNQQKAVTIQSYPGETVWFDGSIPVGGWVKQGSVWVKSGWTNRFDHSPTFARGAAESARPGFGFVNPNSPMAAHPDQVWLDGQSLRQVASAAQVTAGAFYVDEAGSRLVIGSDPAGHDVRASDLVVAMAIQSKQVTVRGIGFRRFSPSNPDFGTIRVDPGWGAGTRLENVTVLDSATMGISVSADNTTLDHVTVQNTGMLGVHANEAYGLRITNSLVQNSNTEKFNYAPASGAIKVSRSRGVTIRGNEIRNTAGTGIWADESVYDTVITDNVITDSAQDGVHLELSELAIVANNVILRSAQAGVLIQNSGHIDVWNNSIGAARLPVWITQDPRTPSNPQGSGGDKRRPFPDPTVPWRVSNLTFVNNIYAAPAGGDMWCGMFCASDQSKKVSANSMSITLASNVYQRGSSATPRALIRWGNAAGGWSDYTSLDAFQAAQANEVGSLSVLGNSVLDSVGHAVGDARTFAVSTSRPVPSAIAAVSSLPLGARVQGSVA